MEPMIPVLTPKFRTFAIIIAVILFTYLITKIRKGNLHIKYSLLWIFICFSILFIALLPELFFGFSEFLGFILPINALTFFSIIFILLILFNLTLYISQLSKENKKLTQELSSLKTEIQEFKKK